MDNFTLIEVLEKVSESAEVRVYNLRGKMISRYDGRDSIDESLNCCHIFEVRKIRRNLIDIILYV